jgi:predicted nucleic acid-binding protein
MSAFADTNWLESLYFKPTRDSTPAARKRHAIVERRMRKQAVPLVISHIVLLEARNVFGRLAGVSKPAEWERLVGDFNGRIFVDPMNWDRLRLETNLIFDRVSHKATIGTIDATLVASARLAGGREFLSFDERLKAFAVYLGLKVFPELGVDGKAFLAQLRR